MIATGDTVRVKMKTRTGVVIKYIGEDRVMLDAGDCNPCYNTKDLEKLEPIEEEILG